MTDTTQRAEFKDIVRAGLAATHTLSVIVLVGAAAAPLYAALLPTPLLAWHWAAIFGAASLVGVASALGLAINDGSFAGGRDKPLEHVSGWSVLSLAAAVAGIVWLAHWAATDIGVDQVIAVEMGRLVVIGVAALFVIAVAATWEPIVRIAKLAAASSVGGVIQIIGRVLSWIDGFLVFAVAGAAGAGQPNAYIRFGMLFGVLATCGAMGYWLDPPWGFIPIVWGFLTAIAMSRCWAWVEDDRELAMLSGRYHGDHLRIGFKQNYRAEALWAFTALFFFVPLALRQAQLLADLRDFPLFTIHGVSHDDIGEWIGFYGTELAKAVPFVDWAEVYHVEGDAPIKTDSEAARHVVFATRVIVDLLLLATLLQALAAASRNNNQNELFYKKRQIFKLDPFTERVAFLGMRMKQGGQWVTNDAEIDKFPPNYDAVRLAELSDEQRYPDLALVAQELRRRSINTDGPNSSEQFYQELMRRVRAKKKDAKAIEGLASAMRQERIAPRIAELDEARRTLNEMSSMNRAREYIMEMIASANDDELRFNALRSALRGPHYDRIRYVREIALRGIQAEAIAAPGPARDDVRHVAAEDGSTNLQAMAREILSAIPQTSPT